MRIALLQAEARPLDPEHNLRAIREAAYTALRGGAELLLTPELFVTGYAPRELAGWLSQDRVIGFPAALSVIASETGIAVAASMPTARPDGTFAIAAGLWDASGSEVLRYEKVHLWGEAERLAFAPSRAVPQVAQWNGRRVALQICYDIEFPEPTRLLAERGAELVLVPTAIDEESAYVADVLVRARAAENDLVVAYADHARASDAGDRPGDSFAGLSIVAGVGGVVYAQAGSGPELLFADVPVSEPQPSGDYLRARRPEVYESWRSAAS